MRYKFGNKISRFFQGGVTLFPVEELILSHCVENLPQDLKDIVSSQLCEYSLVQREIDSRQLNFYKKRAFSKVNLPSKIIKMNAEEAPLIKIKFEIGKNTICSAVLHAVQGRVFCLCFDISTREFKNSNDIKVKEIRKSWRSL